ncbi:hypothetical protein [Isosphaera pallida]|uniref:hypothetical protein n=1 Tax=Isosphaera pallida TaxID=128 RepID=UPI0003028DE3|nr:hypothetical protein [Isosphaera pallida]
MSGRVILDGRREEGDVHTNWGGGHPARPARFPPPANGVKTNRRRRFDQAISQSDE